MDENARLVFQAYLRQSGYSTTVPRLRIFEILSLAKSPLSMHDITEQAEGAADRTSVYRTIELFEQLGIVQRLQIGWKYKLELSEHFSYHHHHATCTKCGKIMTFEEHADLESSIHKLATQIGLELTSHSLELRGVCRDCRGIDGSLPLRATPK